MVGEAGPEILVPPAGSRVLSNPQSSAIARQALQQNPALATGLLSPMRAGQAAPISGTAPSFLNNSDPRLAGLMAKNNVLLEQISQNTRFRESFSQVMKGRQFASFGGLR